MYLASLLASCSWFLHMLLVLLSVAFFTLFERKVIGLIHLRVGPNKVGFLGLLQPLLDAFKLLSKQVPFPVSSSQSLYILAPHVSLFLSLIIWLVFPSLFNSFSVSYSLVVFTMLGSAIVFGVLLAGWSSNSKYSLVGGLRSVAQSISYEAVFTTLLVSLCVYSLAFSLLSVWVVSDLLLLVILPLWVFTTLGETHRAPFDFSESESELVSGFNTEYAAGYFAFVFLSEYSVLLLSCFLMAVVFGGWLGANLVTLSILQLLLSFLFIWIRVTFCRYRYDYLMTSAWNSFLPVALGILLLSVVV